MKAVMWMHLVAMLVILSSLGCGVSTVVQEQQVATTPSSFLLEQEPAGAVSVIEARDYLENQDRIVLVGRISAGDIDPWEVGRAAFFVSDHNAIEHDHGDGHENCPFCKGAKSVTDSLAIIQFVDDDGSVVPTDARELLGVKQDQLIVVSGRGEVDDLGNVVITADGIHLKE